MDTPLTTTQGIWRSLLAASVALALVMALGAASASAASPTACRVRNVTQDTSGDSLIRTAEAAVDGDRLWVRGTCRGEIVIRADIVISGVSPGATLTGQDRTRVVRTEPGARVTLPTAGWSTMTGPGSSAMAR